MRGACEGRGGRGVVLVLSCLRCCILLCFSRSGLLAMGNLIKVLGKDLENCPHFFLDFESKSCAQGGGISVAAGGRSRCSRKTRINSHTARLGAGGVTPRPHQPLSHPWAGTGATSWARGDGLLTGPGQGWQLRMSGQAVQGRMPRGPLTQLPLPPIPSHLHPSRDAAGSGKLSHGRDARGLRLARQPRGWLCPLSARPGGES